MAASEEHTEKLTFRKFADGEHQWDDFKDLIFNEDNSHKCCDFADLMNFHLAFRYSEFSNLFNDFHVHTTYTK